MKDRRFNFGPKAEGMALPFFGTPKQLAACFVALFLIWRSVDTGSIVASTVEMAVIVGVTWLLAYKRVAGQTTLDWATVWGGYVARRRLRLYVRDDRHSKMPVTAEPTDVQEHRSLPAELADIEILEMTVRGYGTAGVIHDTAEDSYTTLVRCQPKGFILKGEDEQELAAARWAGLMAAFAAGKDSCVSRLAFYVSSIPSTRPEVKTFVTDNLRSNVQDDHPGLLSLQQLLDAYDSSPEYEVLMAIQTRLRKPGWLSRKARPLAGLDAHRSDPILEIREQVIRLLGELSRMGLVGYGVPGAQHPALLNRQDTTRAIRDYGDPFSQADRESGVPVGAFGPNVREVHASHIRCDNTLHVTGYLSEWPRMPVSQVFLAPLLMMPDMIGTVAVVMHIHDHSEAYASVIRQARYSVARRVLSGRYKGRVEAEERQQEQHALKREELLAQGHVLVSFAGYVRISVPTWPVGGVEPLTRLNAAFLRAKSRARQCGGMYLERSLAEQQQAWTFTLPLARGLA